jgi:hypothetical protein
MPQQAPKPNPMFDRVLGTFDYQIDGVREPAPAFPFSFELGAAGGGKCVELGLTATVGFGPSGLYPALLLQPVKRGIERPLLYLQDLIRNLLNTLRNCPAMLGFERDRLKDEQVERALHQIAWFTHTMTIYIYFVDSQHEGFVA